MQHFEHITKVGAPDPELKNSPIFDRSPDEEDTLDMELESGVCYFNGKVYKIGDAICSWNELLVCEQRGVWFREGECR